MGGLVSYSRPSLMIIASATQFHVYLQWGQCPFSSVLNVKALVGAFNQEKALVGAFSVIVQPVVEPMDRFAALLSTHLHIYFLRCNNSTLVGSRWQHPNRVCHGGEYLVSEAVNTSTATPASVGFTVYLGYYCS